MNNTLCINEETRKQSVMTLKDVSDLKEDNNPLKLWRIESPTRIRTFRTSNKRVQQSL